MRSVLALSALGAASALNISSDKKIVCMEFPEIITVVRRHAALCRWLAALRRGLSGRSKTSMPLT